MKNQTTLIVAALVGGLLLGYLFGSKSTAGYTSVPNGMHMMSGGHMMNNEVMGDMDDMMNGMMSGLSGKTGDEFDRAFLSEMIVHHQGAVAMAEAALKNAKHQEIKDLANAIISAQNKEISEMKSWQQSWYSR